MVIVLLVLFFCLNILGFIQVGRDKSLARRQAWRIPERVLFITAIVGGSLGVYLGCLVFHHKTRHSRFMWGLPLIILLQAGLLRYFLLS